MAFLPGLTNAVNFASANANLGPQRVTLTGAVIAIYWNNAQYKEIADISFTVDYGEEEIYSIDSPYPQEIAGNKIMVSGSVKSFRLKLNGGLQGKNLRPLFTDVSQAPYVGLRITDRSTSEDIIFIPQCKITSETHTIPAKGVYMIDFNFKGIIPLFALDRVDPSQNLFGLPTIPTF
jgi:hypothetical protein